MKIYAKEARAKKKGCSRENLRSRESEECIFARSVKDTRGVGEEGRREGRRGNLRSCAKECNSPNCKNILFTYTFFHKDRKVVW